MASNSASPWLRFAGKYRICQSFLGEKVHVERGSADLVPALRQTVGVLFSALEPDFPDLECRGWFPADSYERA